MCDEPVELPIEDTIDLHPFQPREVPSLVEEYLFQAVARGFCEVRIVHGRGIGVQRAMVHSILKTHAGVISFRDAADLGSTVVQLRAGPAGLVEER
jgi:dsDNA-specific endonuclease/ATPase MutS2